MHDIAGVSIINATVLGTSCIRHRAIRRLRTEMLDGIHSLLSDMLTSLDSLHATITGKLDGIQHDQRTLRISNLEQNQK